MDVMQAIRTRKSIRSFLNRDVEEVHLRAVLEAGRLAPSANNRQEWRFIVVRDAATRKKLSEAARNQAFVSEAPVVIACCADDPDGHLMTCGLPCSLLDVTIAIDHMTLQAIEEGLGTCWVGAFFEDRVKEILNIPKNIRVIELLPLGYPKDTMVKEKERLPLEKIVMYESWGKKK